MSVLNRGRACLGIVLLALCESVFAAGLDYALKPRRIADGVYVIEGAVEDFSPQNGCNIINTGFLVGDDGVVVINTGPSRLYGEQQRAAIAAITSKPIRRVYNLNLHPDYFFGNQAYTDVPISALAGTIDGARREGPAYADNLYKLCGDWMKGTESTPASQIVEPAQTVNVGGRLLRFERFNGHTSDDLVIVDVKSGVMFAGGLVFNDRTATTPHAQIDAWLASLERLQALPFEVLVPSHGHVADNAAGIVQTRDYLRWLDTMLTDSAERGLSMNEVLGQALPSRYQVLGAMQTEFVRNVTHLYPRYEQRALGGTPAVSSR